jgi:GNAT superfamily N-acetyltransferase
MLWYSGVPCSFVHSLGTRVPYRNRGIARYLLSWLISHALPTGRTVVIDANEDRTPIQFYRRLGFTEEVYWRREYTVTG